MPWDLHLRRFLSGGQSKGGGTSVIPKSVNATRLQQNFDAATISLSGEDMGKIAVLEAKERLITGKF